MVLYGCDLWPELLLISSLTTSHNCCIPGTRLFIPGWLSSTVWSSAASLSPFALSRIISYPYFKSSIPSFWIISLKTCCIITQHDIILCYLLLTSTWSHTNLNGRELSCPNNVSVCSKIFAKSYVILVFTLHWSIILLSLTLRPCPGFFVCVDLVLGFCLCVF